MTVDFNAITRIKDFLKTPSFYILDIDKFDSNYKKLYESFARYYSNYKIAYSFKTNYCPKIAERVCDLGGFAEIVSDFEYEIALKCGFSKNKIIFNGPVKDLNASIDLLKNGGTVVLDNFEELNSLLKFPCSNKKEWNIGIRCNLKLNENKISRFGFDVYSEDFITVIKQVTKYFHLHVLHCHMGGFRDLTSWINRAKELIRIIDTYNIKPDIIDLGSGMFGELEDSFGKQFNCVAPSFDEYAKAICSEINKYYINIDESKRPVLMTEPGTTIVANTLNFYCPITSYKNIRGKWFVEVMGSIHNIGAELAYKKNLPCTLIKNLNISHRTKVTDADIVGYTCLEYDSLQRNFTNEICVGDYIEFRNCGSYSNVIKPPFIIPNFPIVVLSKEKIIVVKDKEKNSDLYKTYKF